MNATMKLNLERKPLKFGAENLARLLQNLEDTSYNEGSEALACRLSDCRTLIHELLAERNTLQQPGGEVVAWRIWRSDRWCFAYSATRDFYRSEKWEPLCVAAMHAVPAPGMQASHSVVVGAAAAMPGAPMRRQFDRPPIELHAAPVTAFPTIQGSTEP